MKIEINTRTGEYKELPTKKEMEFDAKQDAELQQRVLCALSAALMNKITTLGKTPGQRLKLKDYTVSLLEDLLKIYEEKEIPCV